MMENPYERRAIEQLNRTQPGIWEHLDEVPSLPIEMAKEVLIFFIKQACKASSIGPIMIGRDAISKIPRSWVISHIEKAAYQTIDLEDDWEYRRLLELYVLLDSNLVWSLIEAGMQSRNPGVVEAAQDFSEKLRKK